MNWEVHWLNDLSGCWLQLAGDGWDAIVEPNRDDPTAFDAWLIVDDETLCKCGPWESPEEAQEVGEAIVLQWLYDCHETAISQFMAAISQFT